jgi:hypothetical protein
MKTCQLAVTTFSLITAFLPLRATAEETQPVARLEAKSPGASPLRADFEKAAAAFDQALRTNNPEGLFVFVAEDVVMMPPNEAAIRGKAAMQTWYRSFLSAFRTTRLLLIDREIPSPTVGRRKSVSMSEAFSRRLVGILSSTKVITYRFGNACQTAAGVSSAKSGTARFHRPGKRPNQAMQRTAHRPYA